MSKDNDALGAKIKEAGDKVRDLKIKKADKVVSFLIYSELNLYKNFYIQDAVDSAVKELLALKAEFKAANGVDWVPEGGAAAPRSSKPKKAEKVMPSLLFMIHDIL